MAVSTADLCDAHEGLHVADPIFRAYGRRRTFQGAIATVKCYEDNSQVGATLEEPGEGRVLVVDGGGSLRRALLGDRLGALAMTNGWSGLIINGCIRDSEAVDAMEIGVRALGVIPRRSQKQGDGQRDVSVSFAGVQFRPGEYVYADADGVVVAPGPVAGE